MSEKLNNQNNTNENGTVPSKNAFLAKVGGALKTCWRWTKRMARTIFFGPGKELAEMDVMAVENLESPAKMAVKNFFRRKLAVGALVVLISMFLFVFLGSVLMPIDLSYTDNNMANIAPTLSMMKVPKELDGNIRSISGFSNFTVGVSNDNTLYIWGITKDGLTKIDVANFPSEIKDGNVAYAAAGYDHIIAITTDGKIVGWGNDTLAQYGKNPVATSEELVFMPDELNNGIDVSKVGGLWCGYQVTALIYDGRLFMWGNSRNMGNMSSLVLGSEAYQKGNAKPVDVAISNYYAMVLYDNGEIYAPLVIPNSKTTIHSNQRGKIKFGDVKSRIVDITATCDSFGFVDANGEVYMQGPNKSGENEIANIPSDKKVVSLASGTRHIVALTEDGYAYAWGLNDNKQAKIDGKKCDTVFTGAKQTYLLNDGEITLKTGMRGYLFGTDSMGRDTFRRIIHGGKMTMTVGAVAVIVSTIIAIIVGCLSGYFGGWVDMFLMRVTEIFSAIPFLPFAMMLSYVIQKNPIEENTRILIIMVMLGLLSWTGLARMIRGQVLAEREKEFVLAAKAMGISNNRIAFRHILPNVVSVILVSVTLDFAGCMLTESSLSYLGFGVQQPRPTWGNMLNGANNSIVIQNYWWQWVFPAIFLAIATISINIIGDTLRDVLDPKSSNEK